MMHPKDLRIEDYHYKLEEEKIAKFPLLRRDESKLLVYKNGSISEDIYKDISAHLKPESFLVFNDTKVIPARILFKNNKNIEIEIFCLEPVDVTDVAVALQQKTKSVWKCFAGNAKRWKDYSLQKNITVRDKIVSLTATKKEHSLDHFIVEFKWNDENISFAEVLETAGIIPLPPYLHREAEETDKQTYQTIYALHEGSVAAPTAGLHFTKQIFESFEEKNIQYDYVTLHVGAGTFKPVKTATIENHEMHSEYADVSIEVLKNILSHPDGNIIAVGTTSLRTLESLYWLGVELSKNEKVKNKNNELVVAQWQPYENSTSLNSKEAIQVLIDYMQQKQLQKLFFKTSLLIAPGYQFKIVKGLVTNFHQPKSTLLLLVAALVGEDWKKIYEYALQNNFRFLSYGDGCLLLP